jgi:hypothetical protein
MKTMPASSAVRVRVVAIAVALGLTLSQALTGPASAAVVTAAQVRTAVETWVRAVAAEARPDAVVERLEPYPATGRPAAYVAHLTGGGYCLAGADDRLLPVTLYQPHDAYDPHIPDLAYLLDDYVRRLDRLEAAVASGDPVLAQYAAILAVRRADWTALVRGQRPPSYGTRQLRTFPTVLTLPLTSTWDQRSPYNDQCPVLTPNSDEHAVVGCVATAAVQIMYYWQWPPTLTGGSSVVYYDKRFTTSWLATTLTHSVSIPAKFAGRLEWDSSGGGQLRMNGYWDDSIHGAAMQISEDVYYANALATLWSRMTPATTTLHVTHDGVTIDWSVLNDDHTDPPDAGGNEAAELSYQFAVASHMGFGLWGSGTNHEEACDALADHFRYDPDSYNTTGGDGWITDEIAWLRPVQLAGASDSGGHSWVVHGYDTSTVPTEFLMNMGWGGAPAWNLRDDVYPIGQSFVVNIAPASVVRFVGAATAGDGTPAQPYRDLAAAAAAAPSGATLIFQAGSDNPFAGASVTLNRPMTLKGVDVTIRPQ